MESPSGIIFAVVLDGGVAVLSLFSEPQPLTNKTKQQAHIGLPPKAIPTFSPFRFRISLKRTFLERQVAMFALFQFQLNALMLLLDRHVQAGTVRQDFQRLVNEGVESVGLETMKDRPRR